MFQLFSDFIVRATDLNRNSGKVLDSANHQPVTIIRNNEQYALMRRELAHKMATSRTDALLITDLVMAVLALQSDSLEKDHPYSWLRAFDAQEQREMISELVSVFSNSSPEYEFENEMTVEAVVHEWHESALAILSETHNEAFEAISNEDSITLQEPSSESNEF